MPSIGGTARPFVEGGELMAGEKKSVEKLLAQSLPAAGKSQFDNRVVR